MDHSTLDSLYLMCLVEIKLFFACDMVLGAVCGELYLSVWCFVLSVWGGVLYVWCKGKICYSMCGTSSQNVLYVLLLKQKRNKRRTEKGLFLISKMHFMRSKRPMFQCSSFFEVLKKKKKFKNIIL